MSRLCVMIGLLALLVSVQSRHFLKFSYEEMREDDEQDSLPMMELLKPLNVLHFQPMWTLRGSSWNNCQKPSKVVTLKTLAITPDPIRAGGSVQVSVQGSLQETLSSPLEADVKIEAKTVVGWKPVHAADYPDICSKLPAGTCPIKQGPVNVTKSFNVPSQIPAGEFRVTVNLQSKGTWLACFQVTFDISH